MTTIEAKLVRNSFLSRPLALDWEKVLYVALILAAFATRFADLGVRVMSHDESLHTYYSWRLYRGEGFEHSPLMHGPLQFHLIALSYYLFGDSDFTARIPAALAGVAAVGLMWVFRRWLGRAGTLVATLLMVISPYLLYYDRYTRNESFVVLWALLSAWAVFRYMETCQTKWLYLLAAATALQYATKETSFIYHAIFMLFIGLHLVRELFAVQWPREENQRPFRLVFWLSVGAVLVALGLLMLSRGGEPAGTATVSPVVPGQAGPAAAVTVSPFLRGAAVAGGVAGLLALVGAYLAVRGFGPEIVRRFPALDLLVIFGTFVLPQLVAFPVKALGWNPLDYSSAGMGRTALVLVPLMAIAAAAGLFWDWKKWLISAAIFYSIYVVLYTTVFTNGGGFFTGMVGSLGYWLVQQGVQRGSQPWYYYILLQAPVYEFLPALGALLACFYGVGKWWRGEANGAGAARPGRAGQAEAQAPDGLSFPVLGFIGFWAALSVVAYSTAGEKMPWLTVHITLPLILLAGWALGRLVEAVDWESFRRRQGWLAAILLPLLLISFASALKYVLLGPAPFQGKELDQLQATTGFLAALAMTGLFSTALYYTSREWEWRSLAPDCRYRGLARLGLLTFFGLLAVLTARAAFVAAFINYDDATEYLVYAHSARGVKTVMAQVEEISRRTSDGLGIEVAYDDDVAWPMTWYMRNYYNQRYYQSSPTREQLNVPLVIAGDSTWAKVEPLLGNRYYSYEYIRMVWPMQDYFGLTWERIKPVFTDARTRKGLWDIWFNRDYKAWGEITGVNYELSRWPVVDRMRFYIRKDTAARIWNLGVGPTALAQPLPEDPYKGGRVDLAAGTVWGSAGQAEGQFNEARGIAVSPDGLVYVADAKNNRIQQFDATGRLLLSWGTFGAVDKGAGAPGELNEPWGVAVGPDGSVYVADTWNHRIQKFDASGQFLTMWGTFGQAETPTAFWGPRGVAVDGQGRVFVSDTGNKRVVVFDADGGFIAQIGQTGYLEGQFDEPVGVAVSPDGRVYVADTWNLRVQWFTERAPGVFDYGGQWPISGWSEGANLQSLNNKPYLAVGPDGRVYVSDPEGYRMLVFDADGKFLQTWGDYGAGTNQFALPVGVAVGAQGDLYVVDSANSRVMVFSRPPVQDQAAQGTGAT